MVLDLTSLRGFLFLTLSLYTASCAQMVSAHGFNRVVARSGSSIPPSETTPPPSPTTSTTTTRCNVIYDCWCTRPSQSVTWWTDAAGCRPCSCVTVTSTLPPSSTITSSTPTLTPTPTSQSLWGQCGGIGWTGPTVCAEGKCHIYNDWYSKCLTLREDLDLLTCSCHRSMYPVNVTDLGLSTSLHVVCLANFYFYVVFCCLYCCTTTSVNDDYVAARAYS